jgi:hypothetical protein
LAFFAHFQHVFLLILGFVLSSFFGTFVDSKRLVEFVPSIFNIFFRLPEKLPACHSDPSVRRLAEEESRSEYFQRHARFPFVVTFSVRFGLFCAFSARFCAQFRAYLSSFFDTVVDSK